jgi:glyoxylase-like metal-dependent hydrolase (beta-lactamase superfamily II)
MKQHIFFKQIEVGEHAVFAYLIGDIPTGKSIVVDPAGAVDQLVSTAEKNQLEIESIVNTHGHIDHVMGNAEMQVKTGAKIVIHEAEAAYLEKIGDHWLTMFDAQRSPPADNTVKDGDVISVGSHEWKVIHTPGHTPGGICLYQEQLGACLTGDTLFVGSVGRSDGPMGSEQELFNSIHNRLMALPDETFIFPGHDYGYEPFSTIGSERKKNPFLKYSSAIFNYLR